MSRSNRFAGITAVLSLLVSIVMIGIFTAALVNLWDDPLCYIHHEEYLCKATATIRLAPTISRLY